MKSSMLVRGVWLLSLFLAISGCGPTLEERQQKADTQLQLGVAEYTQGNLEKAMEAFKRARKHDPNNPEVYIAFGLVYFEQRKYGEAITAFKKALQLDPNFLKAHNNLGTTYAQLQNWDQAIMHFKEARNDPLYRTPELAHYNLGLALMERQRQGDLIEAVKEFHAAVKIRPDFVRALEKYGVALYRLNRSQEAIKQLKKAIEVDSEYIDPYHTLGIVYMKLGKREEAIAQFKHVLEHSNDDELTTSAGRYLEILE